VLGVAYAWMRVVTYHDDQRLLQMILKFKLIRANPNRRMWTARSYSSHRPREGK
jgi:type IV secretory pathway VirB3-like protein